ncbi:GGDEF domain-containing protein [Virgibacillus sp. W0430]|uniref:GGDEF domain-containing protein n=1 Tax=Virgibacillus sp. W0430 TaxID=3391580 RepID=UPI003F482C4A
MNKLLNKRSRILFLTVVVLLLNLVVSIFFLPYDSIGLILFVLAMLVSIIGVMGTVLASLGLTLVLFFLIGSGFFWVSFSDGNLFVVSIPYVLILAWMIILLLLSLAAGQLSSEIKTTINENNELREQIRTLVAIDPITGFDNKERMLVELELEFNRSKRYGHTFTLILIKINHMEQFGKLYGDQELSNLLQYFSQSLYKSVRASDHKYRPEKDTFALLLTDTPVDDAQLVINKLNNTLQVYQLQNKKFITLQLTYGVVGFSADIKNHNELYDLAMEQVEEHVS